MALSPNYSWAEPDNSSLVKNGAADIRTLGDAIDTSVWNVGFGQAAKNKIINGDMRFSQRGTTFTITNSAYTLDRYFYDVTSAVPTGTVSQQTFTAGAAPVAGYEAASFLRVVNTANNGCTAFNLAQRVEDVRTFAGQTVTFSYWAKADAAATMTTVALQQVFGSGGSGTVTTILTMSSMTLGTGWTRYTGTVAVPSISGKTIGTGSYVNVVLVLPNAAGVFRNGTYDFWGWQLEYGSKATPFQTATGTLQGELAACQRYFSKSYATETAPANTTRVSCIVAVGVANTSRPVTMVRFPVTMRTTPTMTIYATDTGNSGEMRDINSGANIAAAAGIAGDTGANQTSVYPNGVSTTANNLLTFHYTASSEL